MVMPRRGASSRTPRLISASETAAHRVVHGDCVAVLEQLPAESVDLVFADPPYNLQLKGELKRPDDSRVDAVADDWDKFSNFSAYDDFTRAWLWPAAGSMKPNATLWAIGSYHNIFRVGAILQDLGFWILNDVIWRKSNPMPNFRGRRFTNAHETLIWASRDPDGRRYTFNYEALKAGNEDIQVRSDWTLALCTGEERLKGTRRQKAASDAEAGSAAGARHSRHVAPRRSRARPVLRHRHHRRCRQAPWPQLHRDRARQLLLRAAAERRIAAVDRCRKPRSPTFQTAREAPRVPFSALIERGMIAPGAGLFDAKRRHKALVRADGAIVLGDAVGSIHRIGALAQGLDACNGWTFWHVERKGSLTVIDRCARR